MELTTSSCNYILDTVEKIDKLQKQVNVLEENQCRTCEKSLLAYQNNTIPVSFTLCSGNLLTAHIGTSSETTTFFRIEEIRCKRYVTLRLLENDDELEGTNYTLIFDLECACAIQCVDAIQVLPCNLT